MARDHVKGARRECYGNLGLAKEYVILRQAGDESKKSWRTADRRGCIALTKCSIDDAMSFAF